MPESDSRVATRIDPGSGQKVRTSKYFYIITKYFHCQVEQPVLVILKQMLPVYQQLCSQYNNDPDLTEAVCSNLKQGVATLQDDIRPLTQEVGSTLHYIITLYIIIVQYITGADLVSGVLQSLAPASSAGAVQAVLHHVRQRVR